MLDIKRMVDTIRRAKPDVYFSLEMITRDPLEVPCLTDKYWATFDDVNGVQLARLLSAIQAHKPRSPLPRISGLTPEERYALELEHVERSIVYARDHLGLG
jgi:3-oxoisoapionate decarboxylase